MDRLYVVTRSDLAPGAQLAQSCHAVSAFAAAFPERHREWHERGQNLIVLAVPSERELDNLLESVGTKCGLACAPFYEPDFCDELTAFAAPGEAAKLLSSLPLALRAPRAA